MHAHFILLDAEVDEFETELEWNRMQLLLCNIHGRRLELIINATLVLFFMDAEGDDEIEKDANRNMGIAALLVLFYL